MDVGLKTWDEAFRPVIELTTRLSRIVATVSLPANSTGTIDLSALPGTPWFVRRAAAINTAGFALYPKVSISGKTITWDTTSSGATTLIYGVY